MPMQIPVLSLAWILSKPELVAWAAAWKAGSKIVGDVLNLSFNFFFGTVQLKKLTKKKSNLSQYCLIVVFRDPC